MLGLWEVGTGPQRMSLHLAFRMDLESLLQAPAQLQAAGVTPRDFSGDPTNEPVVLAWMPAASLYFHDPDGNQLEFLSMLPDAPEPLLGVVERRARRACDLSGQGRPSIDLPRMPPEDA